MDKTKILYILLVVVVLGAVVAGCNFAASAGEDELSGCIWAVGMIATLVITCEIERLER